jgi:hypothetical protein
METAWLRAWTRQIRILDGRFLSESGNLNELSSIFLFG